MGCRSGAVPETAPRKSIQGRRAKRAKADAVSRFAKQIGCLQPPLTDPNRSLATTIGLIDLFFF